jgi:hypothetical protein
MLLSTLTTVHVILSLVGIATGFLVLRALLGARRDPGLTAVFLATTVLASVTGFLFPFHALLPSHIVGGISLVVLAIALAALYGFHLTGAWRWVYAATAIAALYLNVFVGVAQLFQKVGFLHALAPTQSEPPFAIAQLIVLALFAWLGYLAVIKFRPAG